MIDARPIALEAARELVDFRSGGFVSDELARQQLEGAVAVHNTLVEDGCAYLADEVGLGKTYVALGALSLLRHRHRGLRVLFIAPRANIQHKWIKEVRNFTRRNWLHADQCVRTLQDTPARPPVACGSLLDWAAAALRDPDRDFFLRLTSFSLSLRTGRSHWRARRDQLLDLSAEVDATELDLRQSKEDFKDAVARQLNRVLPHFDLVVIDEAHALKHGRGSGAARNRLLSLILGSADDPGVTRRFDRVLLLSATPLESDYRQLWNQLDLMGHGEPLRGLIDDELDREARRALASRVLLRRITTLTIGGVAHTKNQYRREWRAGGCLVHDEPLEVPDERQRLIVALVQKKVAEVLQHPRFNARFQVGMLASFESFLQTANVDAPAADRDDQDGADDPDGADGAGDPDGADGAGGADEDDSRPTGAFDDADQTADELEREGVDSLAVAELATSYRERFGAALPHPKMDAVVESIARTLPEGDKTLVFVRRVKSVPELAEKLTRRHDAILLDRLERLVGPAVAPELRRERERYEAERRRAGWEELVAKEPEASASDDAGDGGDGGNGRESFFSWFFRGSGPESTAGVLSGGAFRKNRLDSEGAAHSTFFEDDHVADLLGHPPSVLDALADVLHRPRADVEDELRRVALTVFRHSSTSKSFPRRRVFHAYQAAGLQLLSSAGGTLSEPADVALAELFPMAPLPATGDVDAAFPDPDDHLGAPTFFTELRRRPTLREEVWPDPDGRGTSLRERLRERERRRELLSAVLRLGHAFVDLWAVAVRRLGTLDTDASESPELGGTLIGDFLDLLESQDEGHGLSARRELREVGQHHELILSVNFPEARQLPLDQLARHFSRALTAQQPIGGTWGAVNMRLVRQFRMPGFPLVLITTDVLQEGEDLHAFCSRVVHYGITWTPSAMEQRTGRIDRIGSLSHRVLSRVEDRAHPDDLLQVYYPYLPDTVEVLQVDRVLRRMNRFLRLMHRGFADEEGERRIDTRRAFAEGRPVVEALTERLETAFPVPPERLEGTPLTGPHPSTIAMMLLSHLQHLAEELADRIRIDFSEGDLVGSCFGSVHVEGDRLLTPDDRRKADHVTIREQPFRLTLRTHGAEGATLLHAESPVGVVDLSAGDAAWDLLSLQRTIPGAKICSRPVGQTTARRAGSPGDAHVSVEGDVFFSPELTQPDEAEALLRRVTVAADRVERHLLGGRDASLAEYRAIFQESDRG